MLYTILLYSVVEAAQLRTAPGRGAAGECQHERVLHVCGGGSAIVGHSATFLFLLLFLFVAVISGM